MITIQRCDEQGDWIDEITRHSVYAAYRTARSKVLSTGKRYRHHRLPIERKAEA